jgi:hypothetical protein
MEELIQELSDVKGVQNVKRKGGPVLRINLHSREKPRQEVKEIMGDLRKISQRIRKKLEDAREQRQITGWNYIQKPEKKYSETSVGTEKVSDRKPLGHEPDYYRIEVKEPEE